jgi:hypothetical protein
MTAVVMSRAGVVHRAQPGRDGTRVVCCTGAALPAAGSRGHRYEAGGCHVAVGDAQVQVYGLGVCPECWPGGSTR